MPRKQPENESGELSLGGHVSIFGQSRIQKGRQLAQSTDATAMQQYLQNNVSNLTPASGQLPSFNSNPGQGYIF